MEKLKRLTLPLTPNLLPNRYKVPEALRNVSAREEYEQEGEGEFEMKTGRSAKNDLCKRRDSREQTVS